MVTAVRERDIQTKTDAKEGCQREDEESMVCFITVNKDWKEDMCSCSKILQEGRGDKLRDNTCIKPRVFKLPRIKFRQKTKRFQEFCRAMQRINGAKDAVLV